MTSNDLSVRTPNLLSPDCVGSKGSVGSKGTVDADENEPREECGVFGVWAPGEDVAKLTYYGLYALQHRGQEAAGIAVADGSQVLVFKDLGLVSQVFDEQTLAAMPWARRGRALPVLDHRVHHLEKRPADLPHHRRGHGHGARPQREPGEHRGAGGPGRVRRG